MITDFLVWLGLCLAAIPAALFLWNLALYKEPPVYAPGWLGKKRGEETSEIKKADAAQLSILIPARDEARNIADCLNAILSNDAMDYEVIVLDDHSTDGTADIVRRIARENNRVRLIQAPDLPPGWCGKQHACHHLAQAAVHPILVFIDADVRLSRTAIWRIAAMMERGKTALASGIPRQITGGILEKMLVPLIHFVLLGYLPIFLMRRTRGTAFAAGCGQIFIAQAAAYKTSGGHAAIRGSMHDGLMLPRAFRKAGLATDLFDATAIASCRMFQSAGETWSGLMRNAHEGMARGPLILPFTILLLGSGVLPWVMLVIAYKDLSSPLAPAIVAALLSALPRTLSALAFGQSLRGVLLHPLAVAALVVMQWQSLFGRLLKRPGAWKGREYQLVES